MMPIESITRIEFNLPPAVGLLIRCFAENRSDRASVQIKNTHPVTGIFGNPLKTAFNWLPLLPEISQN